jgi:DNA mismatch repair protein MutS
MEKHGGPLGAGAPLGALPLFAGAQAEDPPQPVPDETDPVHAALAELDPDRLSPREALETLYRLKSLLPVSAIAAT